MTAFRDCIKNNILKYVDPTNEKYNLDFNKYLEARKNSAEDSSYSAKAWWVCTAIVNKIPYVLNENREEIITKLTDAARNENINDETLCQEYLNCFYSLEYNNETDTLPTIMRNTLNTIFSPDPTLRLVSHQEGREIPTKRMAYDYYFSDTVLTLLRQVAKSNCNNLSSYFIGGILSAAFPTGTIFGNMFNFINGLHLFSNPAKDNTVIVYAKQKDKNLKLYLTYLDATSTEDVRYLETLDNRTLKAFAIIAVGHFIEEVNKLNSVYSISVQQFINAYRKARNYLLQNAETARSEEPREVIAPATNEDKQKPQAKRKSDAVSEQESEEKSEEENSSTTKKAKTNAINEPTANAIAMNPASFHNSSNHGNIGVPAATSTSSVPTASSSNTLRN